MGIEIFKDIKNLVIATLVVIIVVLALRVENLKTTITDLTTQNTAYTNQIELYKVASSYAEKALQDAKLKSEQVITKIEKVYVPKIKYITEFVKDTNETECQAAERLIDSTVY